MKPLLLIFSISVMVITSPARAVVIDFEDLPKDSFQTSIDTPYFEDGFQLESTNIAGDPANFTTYGTSNPAYTGSSALINLNSQGTTTLSAIDGEAFTLNSIDLSELANTDPLEIFSVTFDGIQSDGTVVSQTFTSFGIQDKTFGMHTFEFTGFTDLTSVSWLQPAPDMPGHQFDNIVINAIPVPAAVWLFASGLLGLAACARRKR